MYEYSIWANRRLLDRAAVLTDEQLRHPFTTGAQPILHTFAHLVGAEWRWYRSWIRAPLTERLTVDDLPTLDAVRAKWEPLFAERRTFIAGLTSGKLDRSITRSVFGRTISLPLWQALIHVANHGTQHRSEIAAMLTDVGHSPGDMDMLVYFLEQQS
jgi:uncharacterized damage-inducible protein DinB